jgi:hypothetical protein
MTPKEIIESHTKDGVMDIPIPVGCGLIAKYIKEVKDVEVHLNHTIQDLIRLQLYNMALEIVINHYITQ